MQQRQRIVAGNWKMNLSYLEGRDLVREITDRLQPTETLVVLAPPFTHLNNIGNIIHGISNLHLGAQNCHWANTGAYTGEVSARMLESIEVGFVIIGHSERREYFAETDEMLAQKTDAVLEHNMRPIFCCGEKLDVREAGRQEEVVAAQLRNGLFHLSPDAFRQVVIAYEPVWAIGTGKTASPQQAQDMHAFIRKLIAEQYGQGIADSASILYGGSCNPANARELFQQPDVDGGLIGGASLKAADFLAIVNSF
jgi:triosephosphate isomerase (TIM)